MTTTQVWFCNDCGVIGALRIKPHEDVMSVVGRMGLQHEEAAPDCGRSVMMLQSIVPENISEDCLIRKSQGGTSSNG